MAYLGQLEFQIRPVALMVECVQNLHHVRKKLAGEKGTELVADALTELGYIGSWEMLNAKDFFVPQSRARIYGVFLKRTKGLGAEGSKARAGDLLQVWSFVKRCQTKPRFQKLDSLLDSLQTAEPTNTTTTAVKRQARQTKSKRSDPLWVKRHAKVKAQLELSSKDLEDPDLLAFKTKAVELGLTDREVDASMSVLGHMKKTGKLSQWQSLVLVANIGDSIDRLKFRENIFPCLLPGQKYLLLIQGKLVLNKDPKLYMALQGLGSREVQHFGLEELSLGHAQDLAGNAFTANICAAVLLALIKCI